MLFCNRHFYGDEFYVKILYFMLQLFKSKKDIFILYTSVFRIICRNICVFDKFIVVMTDKNIMLV